VTATGWTIGIRFPAMTRTIFAFSSASRSALEQIQFPGGKATRGVKLNTQPDSRLRTRGAVLPLT